MSEPNPTDDTSIDDDQATNTDADARPGSDSQWGAEAASSRRTYLKATGLLAALGLGGVASSGTAAAKTDHDHLGESWAGAAGSNHGLEVTEQSSTGFSYGLRGISDSEEGRGVFGLATATSGQNYGLWGKTESTEGTGLSGTATASTGPTQGVLAISKSDQGRGVFGRATSSTGDTIGVRGQSLSSNGTGVLGEGDVGVRGESSSGGFGLETPDDASVGGRLATRNGFLVDIDGNLNIIHEGDRSSGEAGNVVMGHSSNIVTSGGGDLFVYGATISGGGSNAEPNEVYDDFGTIGGGSSNKVGSDDGDPTSEKYATVSGGVANTASSLQATIGGGSGNEANGGSSTISGGQNNRTTSDASEATIGGGEDNVAGGRESTVGGGYNNVLGGDWGTIGGGTDNELTGHTATVAGGSSNNASGSGAAVGGGSNNTASGQDAAVPGGSDNIASGVDSFAAGRLATAQHDRTFVWADQSNNRFRSTGDNQFLVRANGGVGLGTSSPQTQLHVQDAVSSTASSSDHVAFIENTSSAGSADVLSLRIDESASDVGSANNYISFKASGDTAVGSIEGDGAGGITLNSASADVAEYLPRADPEESIEPAEIVGVDEGAVSKRTGDADQVLVVSDQPIVTGNSPGSDPADREHFETVAFVGQVPAKVRGAVETGEVIVPSGRADGTGVAVAPREYDHAEDGPIVGQAWEAAEADPDDVTEVTVAVGLDNTDTDAVAARLADHRERLDEKAARIEELEQAGEQKDERIEELEAEAEAAQEEAQTAREENARLRERLAAVEETVSGLAAADAGGAATPADD